MKKIKVICLILTFLILSISTVYGEFLFEFGLNNPHAQYEQFSEGINKYGISYQLGAYYKINLKKFPKHAIRIGILYSDWQLKFDYEDNSLSLLDPVMLGFDRYVIKIETDEHWKSFQFPVLLETQINPYLYIITGFTYVIESAGKYEIDAEITLYDDSLGTSYLYEDTDYSVRSNFDKDELENDIYFNLGVGFDIPKSNFIIHPEIQLVYNLTPDREVWEIENPKQYIITITCSIEME